MRSSGLSEFQIELANLFFSLPESAGRHCPHERRRDQRARSHQRQRRGEEQ